MSRHLQIGNYFGAVRNQVNCFGVVMTALSHKQARKLPRHSHEASFISLVLRGSYREQFLQCRTVEYKPFTVGFHPPGLNHLDEVGNDGVDFFNIEIKQTFLEKHGLDKAALQSVPDLFGSRMTWLATKLYSSFLLKDTPCMQVESLVLEMLAEAVHLKQTEETGNPAWLTKTRELLHARFQEPLTVHDVAIEAGVHPVHLSRVFRRKYGQTLGDYLNHLRIQFAARQLRTETGFVDLALEAGFFDQSHFCRVFKSFTGATPSGFRQMMELPQTV